MRAKEAEVEVDRGRLRGLEMGVVGEGKYFKDLEQFMIQRDIYAMGAHSKHPLSRFCCGSSGANWPSTDTPEIRASAPCFCPTPLSSAHSFEVGILPYDNRRGVVMRFLVDAFLPWSEPGVQRWQVS